MKPLDENLITDHVICVYKVVRIDRYALSCNANHTYGTIGQQAWKNCGYIRANLLS